MSGRSSWIALFCFIIGAGSSIAAPYYGKKLGTLKTYNHGASGEVYAVDAKTIHIRGFSYDGQGPDAFFWVGSTAKPSDGGTIVPDEKGTKAVLKAYSNQDITLTLPQGKTLDDIKWFSVWCRSFSANFADIYIPVNFDYPKPRRLEKIVGVMHNTSSGPIVAVDAQTFMIPNFYLDGQAPDAHFWVGTGPKPTANGQIVPDENGSQAPLGRYDGQSLVITLPGDLTIFDIDWLSVWCREFTVDFGHIKIPKDLNVSPSLKMLGVAPQSKLNCEVLSDASGFEVRWVAAGDTYVVQLVSRLADGEYMSFGLSGDERHTVMVGGDVVAAWIDERGNGHAVDYYLDAKAQCSNGRGSCPDYKIESNTNTVRLLNAVRVQGYTMITYQRPIAAIDRWDKPILDGPQAIIWAIGPLNSLNEVSYHTSKNTDDHVIDFGRVPQWNCPQPSVDATDDVSLSPSSSSPQVVANKPQPTSAVQSNPEQPSPSSASSSSRKPETQLRPADKPIEPPAPVRKPPTTPPPPPSTAGAEATDADVWYIPPIECPEPQDNVFYAQIGPAGGKKGYTSITGHVGWGIAWYINGLLIPEITVVRGKTYTFVVEGGNDIENPARYHPLYITDDPVGGYGAKSQADQQKVNVYAGVQVSPDGEAAPSASGRLCEWVQRSKDSAESYQSFGEYQRVLELRCEKGQAAVLQWTPDAQTPDLVYYHCFTHRYLGWKIHVVDQCEFDPEGAFSFLHETNVSYPDGVPVARAFPNVKPVISSSSVVSSKIGVQGNSNASSRFSDSFEMLEGFQPVTQAPREPVYHKHLQVPILEPTIFVEDPFVPNKSVPFQAKFRPGEPQFGGFGASNFGQRFEKAPPVFISKQIVPKLPSRLGNVFQPTVMQMAPAEAQHPVVFRMPTLQDSHPPPPPKLPVPQRPQAPSRRPISLPPIPGFNPQNPPNQKVGPYQGPTPPPIPSEIPPNFNIGSSPIPSERAPAKLQTGASDQRHDYTILTNVWSIINKQKDVLSNGGRRTDSRRRSRATEEKEPDVQAEPEPVAEPGAHQNETEALKESASQVSESKQNSASVVQLPILTSSILILIITIVLH
ncbi:hypothetical protein CHUAL_006836 [Chamberlinius hualienensis]